MSQINRASKLPANAVERPPTPMYATSNFPYRAYGMPPTVQLADGTSYPPFTLAHALRARTVHLNGCFNTDGSCSRWRANGTCQTWKRDLLRFRLPIKHGLRTYGDITPANAHLFHDERDCPFAHV